MKFKGGSPGQKARAAADWSLEWEQSGGGRRELLSFCERWADLMSEQISVRRSFVMVVAATTFEAAGGSQLSGAEAVEAIRMLYLHWYLGDSLRNWAVRNGTLTQATVERWG